MAQQNGIFNLPNRQANYWADTGRPTTPAPTMKLGSTGLDYKPGQMFNFGTPATVAAAPAKPEYSLLQQTKNPLLALGQLNYLNKLGETSDQNTKDLTDYTSRLKSFEPARLGTVNQEVGNINDVFSGKVANDLKDIRDRYAQGARLATDNAIAAGNAARKSQAIGSGIGGSSYFGRQAAALQNEAGAKLAADLADRERADFGYVRGLQGGLLGKRDALANQYSANALLPTQVRGQLLTAELGNLGQLGQMDLQNNIYGVTDNQSNQPWFPGSAPVSGYLPGSQIGGSVNAGSYFGQTGGQPRSYRPPLPSYPAVPQPGFRRAQYEGPDLYTDPNTFYEGDGIYTNQPQTWQSRELGRLKSFANSSVPRALPNVPAPYNPNYQGSEEQFYNNLDQQAYDATAYQ